MSNLPVVDDLYIRRVFDDLARMQVELDSDPLMFGPKRINAKVAQCREYLSRCQQIYLQLADHLHQLSRANRQAKLDYDIKAQDLLANDPEVKSQRAIRDREAVVSSKLRVERETNHIIETAITDLESVIMVVKAKREDLKDIQGRIKDQVNLCREERELGAQWGSAPPPGVRVNLDAGPRVDPQALEQFNSLLDGIEGDSSITDLSQFVRTTMVSRGETPEPEAEVASEPEVEAEPTFVLPQVEAVVSVPESTTTDSEVDDFLDSLDVPAAVSAAKPTQAAPVTPNPTAEWDIDDLLSEFAG